MKKILLATIIGIFLCPMLFSQNIKVVSTNAEGVSYTLPGTAFIVNIRVQRTDVFKGPLAAYARPLMGIDNPIQKDASMYKILSVEMNEAVVSDNKTVTTLSYAGERNSREPVNSTVSTYGNGTLAGVNMEKVPFDINDAYKYSAPDWQIEKPDFEFLLAGPNQVIETDTIVKLITLDTATVRDVSYKHRLVERSEEDKAKEVVEKILKIRRDRMSLLTGYQEVAYPEGTMRYMDEQFQLLERNYLSLFRGKAVSDEKVYTVIVIPEADARNGKIPVCGFSENAGINLNVSSGSTIDLVFETEDFPEGTSAANGIRYNIPATSLVTVVCEGNVLGGGIFSVPQFGVMKTAPATANPKVIIDPATGAALKMDIE